MYNSVGLDLRTCVYLEGVLQHRVGFEDVRMDFTWRVYNSVGLDLRTCVYLESVHQRRVGFEDSVPHVEEYDCTDNIWYGRCA